MRLLLDTHFVLWWEAGSPKLSPRLIRMVEEADAVFVSQASLWEIAIKMSVGKLCMDIEKFIDNVEKTHFEWLDIRNEHLIAVAGLHHYQDHKDPFDRLLVAQSLTEPLLLVTKDQKLARYGEVVRVVGDA